MSEWKFLIPKYHDSSFSKNQRSSYSADLDWPSVGIYCGQHDEPWLFGSFAIDGEIFEDLGEVYWAWSRNWVTGDGYQIHLGRQAGTGGPQRIVDNMPYDKRAMADALGSAVEIHGPDSPEAAAISKQMDHANSEVRSRVPLKCGTCGEHRVFRRERAEPIVKTLWAVGIREVELQLFARRVDRGASS